MISPTDHDAEKIARVHEALQKAWDQSETLPPITFMHDEGQSLARAAVAAIALLQEERVQALVASHIAGTGDEPFVVLKDEDGGWMTRTLAAHQVLTRTAPADEIEAVARAVEHIAAEADTLTAARLIEQAKCLRAIPRNSDELREALEQAEQALPILATMCGVAGLNAGEARAVEILADIRAALSPEGGDHAPE